MLTYYTTNIEFNQEQPYTELERKYTTITILSDDELEDHVRGKNSPNLMANKR